MDAPFFTSALDAAEWSASRHSHLTHGGKGPHYPLVSRLCESQNQAGCYGEQKNLAPAGNRTRAVQPVAPRSTV
jgi:hypothetical protein